MRSIRLEVAGGVLVARGMEGRVPPVVGGEDDNRVVTNTELVEFVQQLLEVELTRKKIE